MQVYVILRGTTSTSHLLRQRSSDMYILLASSSHRHSSIARHLMTMCVGYSLLRNRCPPGADHVSCVAGCHAGAQLCTVKNHDMSLLTDFWES